MLSGFIHGIACLFLRENSYREEGRAELTFVKNIQSWVDTGLFPHFGYYKSVLTSSVEGFTFLYILANTGSCLFHYRYLSGCKVVCHCGLLWVEHPLKFDFPCGQYPFLLWHHFPASRPVPSSRWILRHHVGSPYLLFHATLHFISCLTNKIFHIFFRDFLLPSEYPL